MILLLSYHFNFTNLTWTNHPFHNLGSIQLSSLLVLFLTTFLSILIIIIPSYPLIIIFLITQFFSIILTLFALIFVFISTTPYIWNEYIGCSSSFEGFLSAWNSVDIYLHSVDELFCSDECPCYMNKTTSYKFLIDVSSAPYFSQWNITPSSAAPSKFQECKDKTIAEAYNKYLIRNAYFTKIFKQKEFHAFYKNIEEYFNCNGFCATTYHSEVTNTSMKMVKYLFSDVSKGVPQHIGCLEVVMKWLRKMLLAFGCVCCCAVVTQITLFVLGCLMLWENMKEKKNKKKQRKKEEIEMKIKKRIEHLIVDSKSDSAITNEAGSKASLIHNSNANNVNTDNHNDLLLSKIKKVISTSNDEDDEFTIEQGTFRPNESQRTESSFNFNATNYQQ